MLVDKLDPRSAMSLTITDDRDYETVGKVIAH